MLNTLNFGIIGTGAIGGAIIDRLVNGLGINTGQISACEIDDGKRRSVEDKFGISVSDDPVSAAKADVIILATPPAAMKAVLAAIGGHLAHQPVMVSFAAALPVAFLETLLPKNTALVRVNPNSPSLVGSGYNPVVFSPSIETSKQSLAEEFLAALGTSDVVSDDDMNLYTAITAVGPTYFLPVFDAMIASAVQGGLSREDAVRAVCETARGTATMVETRSENPEDLKFYTGLRPLKDGEVRDLVKAAADDALSKMENAQKALTGSQ